MEKPHLTKVQRLSNDLYNAKNQDHLPAIRWGVEHESVAIEAYQHMTGSVV